MGLFKTIQEQLARIQQNNRESQQERTAPSEVFDRVRNKLEEMQANARERRENRPPTSEGGLFSAIKERIEQARQENEASPTEETAEASIFERMREEIERLEKQEEDCEEPTIEMDVPDIQEIPSSNRDSNNSPISDFLEQLGDNYNNKEVGNYETPAPETTSYEAPSSVGSSLQIGSMAMTNSNGGSLALRSEPNMGAAQNSNRIPHGAQIRILDYSDQNKINLDGQICGWYKIEANGQVGWLLDMYLK